MRHWKTIPLAALSVACLLFTARAQAAPDLSSPKKAAVSFAKAVEAGDMEAVKASAAGTDEDYRAVKSISDVLASMKRFREAAIKKYGDDAKQIPDFSTLLSASLDGAEEKVDGDNATLVVKGKADDKNPPKLKKQGDDWKVDLKAFTGDPEVTKMKETAAKSGPALDAITKDVEAGKYATFPEAVQAFFGVLEGGAKDGPK